MTGNDNAIDTRRRFVDSWNTVMLRIWQEQIILLDAVDTRHLLDSLKSLPVRADGRYYDVTVTEEFTEYGIYVNDGVGREVPRGNIGDINREKNRIAKPWFRKKMLSSYLKMRDFFAESFGLEFLGIVSNVIAKK